MPTITEVKELFARPNQYYLDRRQYDIKLRAEVVQAFAGQAENRNVLDIGAGDGSLSLSLLRPDNHMTLVDLSTAMTELASARVPGELKANVEVRNENFMEGSFDPQGYDLIICIGLLAHVESPVELIAKIARSLRPGGRLILEFTDSVHFLAKFTRLLQNFIWSTAGMLGLAPASGRRYRGNVLSYQIASTLLGQHGLSIVSTYRHAIFGLPGIHRFLSQKTMYNGVRFIFGSAQRNRNAWLGNEYICLVVRDSELSTGRGRASSGA